MTTDIETAEPIPATEQVPPEQSPATEQVPPPEQGPPTVEQVPPDEEQIGLPTQEQPPLPPGTTTIDHKSDTESKHKQEEPVAQSSTCKRIRCISRCCCVFLVVLIIVFAIVAGLVFYFVFYKKPDPSPVAYCGDCHCIIDDGSGSCPSPAPVTNYSSSTIAQLKSQTVLNPYLLSCNPYNEYNYPDLVNILNETCMTDPPLEYTDLGDEAACGIHYEETSNACPTRYSLKSYPSWEQAELAGAFVTHAGACGACSTTQDLAAYMASPDLQTEGKYCSKQAALAFDRGVRCYLNLGFTQDCAYIWTCNSLNTAELCLERCATTQSKPNNGPPPECELNDCLLCDEEISGPIFKKFAARTRRRSGLLSAIARPCSALVPITQESCPVTLPLIE